MKYIFLLFVISFSIYSCRSKDSESPENGLELQNSSIKVDSIFFSSGEVHSFGKVDLNSQKRLGTWKWFYQSGNLKTKGEYLDGYKNGTWMYYHNSSEELLSGIVDWKNGLRDGRSFTFNLDSIKTEEVYFKGGLKVDSAIFRYENGNLERVENYKEGELNGVVTHYYPNGLIYFLSNWRNGKKEGLYFIYNEFGILMEQGNYVQDKFEGTVFLYDSTGKEIDRRCFIQGQSVDCI